MRALAAYGLAALMLAGCGAPVSTPQAGGAAAQGRSLAERWKTRVVTLTVAERISDQCYAEGISLAPSRWRGAVNRATEEMVENGADRDALEAVYSAHDFNETAAAVDTYLVARGALADVPESLCTIGEAEIEQGSDVGRVLQKL